MRGSGASGHGRGVWTVFSDPRSLSAPADLSGREAERLAFLSEHGFGAARREPVSGDASTRAYERLHVEGRPPLIFMDAPPAAESGIAGPEASTDERIALGYNAMARLAASRVDAFAAVAGWLRSRGLSAPAIVAMDADKGFAVLEDLGSDLFVNRLAAGEDPHAVYGAATDLLVALHAEAPPASLPVPGGGAWPLLPYDALALKTGVDLFLEWWPQLSGVTPRLTPRHKRSGWPCGRPCWPSGEEGATVFTHRDYHAENLLWLPEREGAARVGLLDFQDAVRGHPAWDLIHLLQDARRDVAPEIETAMIARYLAARPALDADRFRADYAALGALNAARILGPVFARQIVLFGREKYRAFLPRTWRALERNLDHPEHDGAQGAGLTSHVPCGLAGVSAPTTAMVLAAGPRHPHEAPHRRPAQGARHRRRDRSDRPHARPPRPGGGNARGGQRARPRRPSDRPPARPPRPPRRHHLR